MSETIDLKYEVQFPGMSGLPYRVVYNGNSLMSICSDADKVVVALPPEIPEGRHAYFQCDERQSKSMQFMVYAANRHHALTDALREKEAEVLSLKAELATARSGVASGIDKDWDAAVAEFNEAMRKIRDSFRVVPTPPEGVV